MTIRPRLTDPTHTNIYGELADDYSYFDDVPRYCDYLRAVIGLFDFRCHSIVDIGCGDGVYGEYILENWGGVKAYLGYDHDPEVIGRAGDLDIRLGRLPDIDDTRAYDVVLCHSVLQYVTHLDAALAKLRDLCRPTGFVSLFQTLTREDYLAYQRSTDWHDPFAYQRSTASYRRLVMKYFDVLSYGILVPKGALDNDPYRVDRLFLWKSRTEKI